MAHGFGTSRRLALGFGALVALFAAASAVALAGSARVHDGLAETRRREEGVRLSLELASAVRDQYAHQAHTIIIGDASHLGFYGEARSTVARLTRALRQAAERPEERALVDSIDAGEPAARPDLPRADRPGGAARRSRARPGGARAGPARRDADPGPHPGARRAVRGVDPRGARRRSRRCERRTRRFLVALLVAAPLVAIAVSLLIARSIAVPVARLEAGAARIAAGDLEARIEVRGAPELEALAGRWNEMTAALKEHQQRLVESEKLAGIGRLAAGVAHEINNPLGVILGYAKLLARKADGAAVAEDLAVIEEETLRAKEIVDGLLDLSRPLPAGRGAGGPARARGRGGLAPRRGAAPRRRGRLGGRGRERAGPPGEAPAGAREPRAERGRGGGRGRPRRGAARGARRERRGRGRGLRAGDPARAARPPLRALLHDEAARDRPRPRGLARDRARARRRPRGGRRRRRAARGSRCGCRCGERGRPEPWRSSRVLVVDDKENMRKLVARILEEAFAVEEAEDGARALSLVATRPYDVVVTDIRMPGADGFELLAAVKARAPATEVVIMTGYATVQDAVARDEAGRLRLPREAVRPGRRARGRDAGGASTSGSSTPTRRAAAPGERGLVPRPRRTQRADAGGLPAAREGGGGGRDRAPHRRDRHREGARRAGDPLPLGAPRAALRAGELRRAPRRSSSRASCSATRAARSPARRPRRPASSRRRRAGRSSSTRSASCRSPAQVKLNRALQEKEIRRVGGNQAIAGRRPRDRGDPPRPARGGPGGPASARTSSTG